MWATRTVMRFSDEAIAAMVATGEYDDPAAEAHVVKTLIERRDKIVDYYLTLLNPIDGFEVQGTGADRRLRYTNLGADWGLASDCGYGYAWHTFDNDSGAVQAIARGSTGISPRPDLRIPDADHEYLMVKLSTSCPAQPNWTSEVRVFIRNGNEVVGIERNAPDS